MEAADLGLRLIDLSGALPVQEQLALALRESSREPQLAGNQQLLAPRLARLQGLDTEVDSAFTLPVDGSVLITGGLGALGLAAARWLAEEGLAIWCWYRVEKRMQNNWRNWPLCPSRRVLRS